MKRVLLPRGQGISLSCPTSSYECLMDQQCQRDFVASAAVRSVCLI